MFRFTFQEYKKTYKSRLLAYLEEYEDNTPDLFLEDELKTYNAIHNKLKFIVDNFDKNFEEEINEGRNKQLYLFIINAFIKSQHNFKPIPKSSIPHSLVNAVLQSILNPKPKTISKVKNIPIPQYTKEELNIILNDSWDSSCNEDYIKSNMKKIYNNIITSTKRIIDFINEQQKISKKSIAPENEIDVTKFGNKDNSIIAENPQPRIFKSYEAFTFFEKLIGEFGNTKNNLSNYSFVYHKMMLDDLIYQDIKQLEYFDFLATYDIHISRIKSLNEIGKKQFRESIYASAK